jgi:hypothetical protein
MYFLSGFGQHDENDNLFYAPSTAHNSGRARFDAEDIIQCHTGDRIHAAGFVNWPYYTKRICNKLERNIRVSRCLPDAKAGE